MKVRQIAEQTESVNKSLGLDTAPTIGFDGQITLPSVHTLDSALTHKQFSRDVSTNQREDTGLDKNEYILRRGSNHRSKQSEDYPDPMIEEALTS